MRQILLSLENEPKSHREKAVSLCPGHYISRRADAPLSTKRFRWLQRPGSQRQANVSSSLEIPAGRPTLETRCIDFCQSRWGILQRSLWTKCHRTSSFSHYYCSACAPYSPCVTCTITGLLTGVITRCGTLQPCCI